MFATSGSAGVEAGQWSEKSVPSARAGIVAAGIRAYVSVRHRSDGAWAYSIGRVSPFVPFDVLAILRELNAIEDPERGTWGGSNLVGGSPRMQGSALLCLVSLGTGKSRRLG